MSYFAVDNRSRQNPIILFVMRSQCGLSVINFIEVITLQHVFGWETLKRSETFYCYANTTILGG